MKNIVSLSVSRNYVSDWDFWEMFREFAQNALDSKGSIQYTDNSIHITNSGKIQLSALLYGGGTKQDDATSIGKHGEGLKNALLVAVRSNRNITILNDDELWIPSFKQDPAFGAETLCIEKVPTESTGSVVITLENITEEELALCKERCIDPNKPPEVAFGSIAEGYAFEPENEPMLYVGGLYVSEMPKSWYESKVYRYSYNFPPHLVHLDRDRNSVNDYEIQDIITQILIGNNEIDILLSLGYDKYLDVEGYTSFKADHYYSGGTSEESLSSRVADKALELFYTKWGEDAYPIPDNLNKLDLRKEIVAEAGLQPVLIPSKIYSVYKQDSIKAYGAHNIEKFDAVGFLEELLQFKKYSLRGEARTKIKAKVAFLKKYHLE